MTDIDFQILVLTPASSGDPSLAIAAARAGHLGLLNWELPCAGADLAGALSHLCAYGRGAMGVKLHAPDKDDIAAVIAAAQTGLGTVVLDAGSVISGGQVLKRLAGAGLRIIAEITEWDDHLAKVKTLDAIMVKGHEAGGRVGEQTSFILLQKALARQDRPVYVRGGLGLHSTAAARAGGAAGAVLDDQLLLVRESGLAERMTGYLSRFTGSETGLIEIGTDRRWRAFEQPGSRRVQALRTELYDLDDDAADARVQGTIGWDIAGGDMAPMGQAAVFAPELAAEYGALARVARAFAEAGAGQVAQAAELGVLGPGSGVAETHGTQYPIVQGPMTRVSDTAAFAQSVAEAGGLPMVALALMRPDKVETLLAEVAERLGDRPWGVGLLGFAPSALIKAQTEVSLRHGPDFALIAGGRPDQAKAMEDDGIASYLHVPSPNLLAMFLEQGARRFVFEGRECGGHVGPLASFVLWDRMVTALLREVKDDAMAGETHVLFAGGIHDDRSAAMVAALAAPLAARGIKVGVLIGTAYLFTAEAVAGDSIVKNFQKVALDCEKTVTLETGPGHASRAAMSPFAEEFSGKKRKLEAAGTGAEEIRDELEDLTLGRLRIATKATERKGDDLVKVPAARQKKTGMYMIGQAATLRDSVTSIVDLHAEVSAKSQDLLQAQSAPAETDPRPEPTRPADVAIVGIGTLLPKANSADEFWDNILDQVNAIREIPADRWDSRLYFDEDRDAKDKIYSRWGGFLDDMEFDPFKFGIVPKAIPAIDPLQLMTLEVGRRCLDDAGMDPKTMARQKASVILGASGGAGDVGAQYAVRAEMTRFLGKVDPDAEKYLPEWTEDSFAGILLNVAAGRSANRFDFGGVNYTVDAACASSLTAIYQAVLELETRRSDVVIAGGIDTVQGPFGYLCFSKTQALSPRGRCGSFEATADGIVISEGIAMVALKRLEDAERDGDKIYAVIKGVGGSSDGRAKSMTAPHPDGQIRALNRAYEMAGYSPATVGLFEAHGTGTVAGDTAELETVTRLLDVAGGDPENSAIGSVKTMIGHTKASAGVAGLIKAAMAVHHGILPPHGRQAMPNKRLTEDGTRLFLVDQPEPWLRRGDTPRRAGISAFGFGGTNFHLTMEEYDGARAVPALARAPRQRWSHELLMFGGADRAALAQRVQDTLAGMIGEMPDLRNLAYTLNAKRPKSGLVASIVVGRDEDLVARLTALSDHLSDAGAALPSGASVSDTPLLAEGGQLAYVFPGQGTQYPGMLRDLATTFPEMHRVLEQADAVLADRMAEKGAPGGRLSRMILPVALYDDDRTRAAAERLTRTDVAQPALGAVEAGLLSILSGMGLAPQMTAGHSYGEFVALHSAGVLNLPDLLRVSEARGRFMVEAGTGGDLGTMAAVMADRDAVSAAISDIADVIVANHNAPAQTILSGPVPAIEAAIAKLDAAGMTALRIPVGAAFHSPIVAPASDRLAAFVRDVDFAEPACPVYANSTGGVYPTDADAARALLAGQLAQPVEFVAEIEAMYAAGARVFLNVGPKGTHANMVRQILGDRPHRAIAIDDEAGGLRGLLVALGALVAEGATPDLDRLWRGRGCETVALGQPAAAPAKHLWLLNGGSARPIGTPPHPILTLEEVERRKATPTPPQPTVAPVATAPHHMNGAAPAARHPSGYQEDMAMDQSYPPQPEDDEHGHARQEIIVSGEQHAALSDFQATMTRFLETQEQVMLAYMGTGAGNGARPVRRRAPAMMARPQPVQMVTAAPRRAPAPAPAPAPVAAAPAPAPAAAPAPAPVAAPAPTPAPAPAAAAPAPVVAAAPASAALDETRLTDMLLALVEDRTGYPRDMLGMDQNIEADLGIDSIKRVEIVGALLKELPAGPREAAADMGEALNEQKTLSGMISTLWQRVSTAPEVAEPRPFDQGGVVPAAPVQTAGARPPRYVMRPEAEAMPADAGKDLPQGLYLITEDGTGLAKALARQIKAAGAQARMIDPATLDVKGDLLAQLGDLTGLVGLAHLAPVGAPDLGGTWDPAGWKAQIDLNEKLAHGLMRVLAPQLKTGRVVFASALGGMFGRDRARDAGLRAVGGGPGLAKSLREEWPEARAKAIDLDPGRSSAKNAGHVLAELASAGGRIEVGYPAGQRTIFRSDPVEIDAPERLEPTSDWVVLATGGARGITAEILRPLAARGVTLVLMGRSPLPGAEPAELAGVQGDAALRTHFLTQARAAGEVVTPATILRQISAVQRDREIRANLRDLQELGAKVEYRVADVSDPEAFRAAIDALYDSYGRIDGVLHGAGVIEDKLVVDKTPDSWSRVVDTKLLGAYALAHALRPDSLKFLGFFTSVAGRYGNSGQADYAAANEVLNRVALALSARWQDQVKVAALNWGPWQGTRHGAGMVSDETQRKFEALGVELVDPEGGAAACIREMLNGAPDAVEVVYGVGPWEARETRLGKFDTAAPVAPGRVLIGAAEVGYGPKGGSMIARPISPETDPWLQDHAIDGTPVMPLAFALEACAETAAAVWPDWQVSEISGHRLLNGLKFEDGAEQVLEVIATGGEHGAADGFNAKMMLRTPGTPPRIHYRSMAHLVTALPPAVAPPAWTVPTSSPITAQQAYADVLSHGPRFQLMTQIDGLDATGISARVSPDSGTRFGGDWLFDAGLIDVAAQMAWLWSFQMRGTTALPNAIGSVRRFDGAGSVAARLDFRLRPETDQTQVVADAYVLDEQGRALMIIEGLEATANETLNRINGWAGKIVV